uniref:LRRCT domain-containing protein n=1 Tax=Bracon brevicornis TaxID=1563983 RepID=A0A6V7IRV7_9HYME
MMNIKIFTIVLIILPLTIGDRFNCFSLSAFNICGRFDELTYVNQTQEAKSLELRLGGFSSISPNAFQDLTITELSLIFSNQLFEPRSVQLQQESFQGLTRLRELNIEFGLFSVKPSPFKYLKSLTRLVLYNCALEEVPQEVLTDFARLSEVVLDRNKISNITVQSFSGTNVYIKKISLASNAIESIEPRSFSTLQYLKILSLSDNQLTDVLPGIFDGLDGLEHLELNRNKITVLHKDSFKGLYQLKALNLEFNQIREIEFGAFSNLNLHYLNLGVNLIRNLPVGLLDDLKRLQKLDLQFNKFTVVPRNIFGKLKRMDQLYLESNEIERIESYAFANLNLTILELRNNKLKTLEADAFNGLNVTSLGLSNNGINDIEPLAFRNLTARTILLYGNNVNQVDVSNWNVTEFVTTK